MIGAIGFCGSQGRVEPMLYTTRVFC